MWENTQISSLMKLFLMYEFLIIIDYNAIENNFLPVLLILFLSDIFQMWILPAIWYPVFQIF